MILLKDICSKLEKVLNGNDTEVIVSPSNEKYDFRCYSEGLYLSTIGGTGKNFIPVIIGSLGGNYNPVPNMEQADYSINIQLFYPVRFKDDFYALNEFLVSAFVGKTLLYGNQYALSNISVAQYGELQNIDLNEFAKWINNTYAKKIDVMETYMSMSFTLYLSTAYNLNQANGMLYGNEWKSKLYIGTYANASKTINYTGTLPSSTSTTETFKNIPSFIKVKEVKMYVDDQEWECEYSNVVIDGDNVEIDIDYEDFGQPQKVSFTLYYYYVSAQLTDTEPFYITQTDISNSEPIAQQVLGEKVSLGKAVQTSYTKELPLYVKNTSGYQWLIQSYLNRDLQGLVVLIKESCDTLSVSGQRLYFITNFSFVKTKGTLLGISLTLAEDLENE